jgi:polysaccharide export outer membrane protein
MMMKATTLVLVLAALSASAAETPAPPPSHPGAEGAPAYLIGADDVLQVAVWNNEAMSRTVPVRPDGMISLPLINDVPAAGLTPMQLRDALLKRLVEYMPSPEVSVIVTEVRSLKVSVVGEMSRPGRFELKSPATVLDVLAMAGAFTEFAARSRIVVLRNEGGQVQRIPFNYEKVTSPAGEQGNFYVRPGDIILVP